jgi:hypothetical protein
VAKYNAQNGFSVLTYWRGFLENDGSNGDRRMTCNVNTCTPRRTFKFGRVVVLDIPPLDDSFQLLFSRDHSFYPSAANPRFTLARAAQKRRPRQRRTFAPSSNVAAVRQRTFAAVMSASRLILAAAALMMLG